MLLRVSRAGAGHAAECERVADRIVGVLDSLWSTDHNGLTMRAVPNEVFDRMWERGAVEKDGPCWHWNCLEALLGPPPAKIARTASRRLPDPPRLETFSPQSPGGLMPVGVIGEGGTERLVGVSWGGPTDALVDWTIGASGSGKTWHALVAGGGFGGDRPGVFVVGSPPDCRCGMSKGSWVPVTPVGWWRSIWKRPTGSGSRCRRVGILWI